MERTFTTTTAGITALHLPAGRARVTVDPAAKTAVVRLHTQDKDDSPAADAIRNTRSDARQGLSVVPHDGRLDDRRLPPVRAGRHDPGDVAEVVDGLLRVKRDTEVDALPRDAPRPLGR